MIPLVPLTRAAAVEGLFHLLLLPLCALDAVLRALKKVRTLSIGARRQRWRSGYARGPRADRWSLACRALLPARALRRV